MQPCREVETLYTHANGTALYRLARIKERFFLGLHHIGRIIYTSEVLSARHNVGACRTCQQNSQNKQEEGFVGVPSTPFVSANNLGDKSRTQLIVAG